MQRLVDKIGLRIARKLRGKHSNFSCHDVQFASTAGYRIAASLLLPDGHQQIPAVVLCPGADQDRQVFFNGMAPIQAQELAAKGVAVLCHDPSGRGLSWGPEDWGGLEHQDNVVEAIRWLRTAAPFRPTQVGIVGISLGLASAAGAAKLLAHSGEPISWLIDWEGPCDQRSITANQTMNAPAMGHRSADETYWAPREAVRHVGEIHAGYWRLQAAVDHAQPGELQHARDMFAAAADAGLPWFQLNDHAAGEIPENVQWLRAGQLQANRALRRAVSIAISRG